jgi:tripartite-type tricarboxylate transporter receptor subunit TctC
VRAPAFARAERWPALPDVPTLVEIGYPDFVIDAWAGVVAPTGTPPSIIDKLNASISAGLKTPAAQQSLAKSSPISARRTILKVFSPARRRNGGAIVKLAGARIN